MLFACRECLKLADKTENLTPEMRLLTKKWALMRELGVDSFYASDSEKPKWMHLSSFHRKLEGIRSVDFELDAMDMDKELELYEEGTRMGIY